MAIGDIVLSIVVLTTVLITVLITVHTTVLMGIGPGCTAGIGGPGCMVGIVLSIHTGMASTVGGGSGSASFSNDRKEECKAKLAGADAPAIGASALESFKP